MKLILAAISLCFFSFSQAQKTYIWCGNLIDGISDKSRPNQTIIIEGNKITGVQNGFTVAGASDKVIDLKTKRLCLGG